MNFEVDNLKAFLLIAGGAVVAAFLLQLLTPIVTSATSTLGLKAAA